MPIMSRMEFYMHVLARIQRPRQNSRLYHRYEPSGAVSKYSGEVGSSRRSSNILFKSAFRETFRPLGNQTVDALAGSRIQYCFHTASEVAATRRSFKV